MRRRAAIPPPGPLPALGESRATTFFHPYPVQRPGDPAMGVPTSDLIVGAVGAIVLVGLIAGLFVIDTGQIGEEGGSAAVPDADDGMSDGGAGASDLVTDYRNFSGSLDAGVYAPGAVEDQAASNEHTFDVPNGTAEIKVTLTIDSSEVDADCHLYDPNGTKLGDAECHRGSPGSPVGAEFTISGEDVMPGEWTLVVHTSKGDDSPVQANSEVDYEAVLELMVPADAADGGM